MKILFIDSDNTRENAAIKAIWLRDAGHRVDVAAGINVPSNAYDLVIVNLGEPKGQSDLRVKIANSSFALEIENSGASLLFTGDCKDDMIFASKQGVSYCHTCVLSQDGARETALAKATGASLSRG